MTKHNSRLAKLTRPSLGSALQRQTLFRGLDDARATGCTVYVAGPPGAGKTTLVASWLDTREIPGIWYQIDRTDTDLASFFYYFGEAARACSGKRGRRPPLLTPDQRSDVDRFARRFYREIFGSLPANAALVFDNCHEVADEHVLHSLIALCMEEAPRGSTVIAISRQDMPDWYLRGLANEKIRPIGWDKLQLSLDEARCLARSRGSVDELRIARLHDQCQGWAAGFTLLLEHPEAGAADLGLDSRELLFRYFAAEVFRKIPQDIQRFLLGTAHLPWIGVEIAEKVTGNANAGAVLEDLHRRRLFTHRIAGRIPRYRYHMLFREFLLGEAARVMPQEARHALLRSSASLIERLDEWETAVALYAEAGLWDRCADLVLGNARRLLSQGRWQTLRDLILALPPGHKATNPWLGYWLGVATGAVDAVAGRIELEDASRAFAARADALGQMLCATEVLRAYFLEFRSFARVEPWIDLLTELLVHNPDLPDPETQLRIFSGLLGALASRRPSHPLIEECARRTRLRLSSETDANLALTAGISLCFYATMSGRVDLAEEIAAGVRPHLSAAEVLPILEVFWTGSYGYLQYVRGHYDKAIALFEQAERLSEENGLRTRIQFIRTWHAYCSRRLGDLSTAHAIAEDLEPDCTTPAARSGLIWLRALIERSRGNVAEAARLGAQALRGQDADCTLHGAQDLQQAEMLIEAGSPSDAVEWLESAQHKIARTFSEPAWRPPLLLLQALVALRNGERRRCEILLGEVLPSMGAAGSLVFTRWFPFALQQLLPLALEAEIEPDAVRALVRELAIAPPNRHVEHWPWPVRIHTLGRFEVLVQGRPPAYSRKTPRKALSLLAAMVAWGASDIPEERLMDEFWPDHEGDAAHRALGSALHRLRQLLGDSQAIVHRAGRLSLDPARCWVDTLAFESLTASDRLDELERGLKLYRGPFVGDGSATMWSVAPRDRLAARYTQAVGRLAGALEREGRAEAALSWYLRGLEADDLIEPFYQGLLRCYGRLHRHGEALGVYQRLTRLLSGRLGAQPSPATRDIYRSLLPALDASE